MDYTVSPFGLLDLDMSIELLLGDLPPLPEHTSVTPVSEDSCADELFPRFKRASQIIDIKGGSRCPAQLARPYRHHDAKDILLHLNVCLPLCAGHLLVAWGVHPFDAHDLSAISRLPSSFILRFYTLPDLATRGTASEGTATRTSGQYLVLTKKQRMVQSPSPFGPLGMSVHHAELFYLSMQSGALTQPLLPRPRW